MFFTSNCRQVRNLLWDVASGIVTGNELENAEAHLAGWPERAGANLEFLPQARSR